MIQNSSNTVVSKILQGKQLTSTLSATKFAPSNIALIKYWGKRNNDLRLPCNDSISISLGDLGAIATISQNKLNHDQIKFNKSPMPKHGKIVMRTSKWLNTILGLHRIYFDISIEMNIPLGAGLASSACWFASLTLALNELFSWQLSCNQLSILSRLGSGSASRSIDSGFMHWHAGNNDDGRDSYATKLNTTWPELCLGIVMIDQLQKKIDSTSAMDRCAATSPLFASWPESASAHRLELLKALEEKNFTAFGQVAEKNAELMHRTIQASIPSINYSLTETQKAKEKIISMRNSGTEIYFTQDAGPNLKAIFLKKNIAQVESLFPGIILVKPFD